MQYLQFCVSQPWNLNWEYMHRFESILVAQLSQLLDAGVVFSSSDSKKAGKERRRNEDISWIFFFLIRRGFVLFFCLFVLIIVPSAAD